MKERRDNGVATLELLHRLSCCLTEERLMASQVAVLTAVALRPSISSGAIVNATGISKPNVNRIVNYLVDVGDITFIRRNPRNLEYAYLKRLFYMTPQGADMLRKMLRHLGWGDCLEFRLVPVPRDEGEEESHE